MYVIVRYTICCGNRILLNERVMIVSITHGAEVCGTSHRRVMCR
jgi:hypothetical protein